MAKTANVYVRLDPQVKEQSEMILEKLGIPMSNAIALFLQQVILQRGIPFELKLPESKPIGYEAMTDEQFNEFIEQGIADYAAGNVVIAKDARSRINRVTV